MTKKRFVKLLMSHGVQRNKVCEIAFVYNYKGFSYSSAYTDYCLNLSFKNLREAFRILSEHIQKAVISINTLRKKLKNDEKTEENTEIGRCNTDDTFKDGYL